MERPAVTDPIIPLHLDLPSGGSVDFRDPEDLTGDDHRRVVGAIRNISGSEVSMAMDAVYGTACMLIEAWAIPYLPDAPPPRDDFGALGKLKIRDYNAVITAVTPAVEMLFPNESPDDANKPGSPTLPAGG